MSNPEAWPCETGHEPRPPDSCSPLPDQFALRRTLERLSSVWSTPGLPASISIVFSSRLRKALGRADVCQRRVTLAAHLNGAGALLEEVLCHELAHIVAFDLVGKAERVHGPTWQRLVRMAGFAPSRRLQCSPRQGSDLSQKRSRKYLHRCQVCGFARVAARRMPAWRCADCVGAGLDGRLDLTELAAGP